MWSSEGWSMESSLTALSSSGLNLIQLIDFFFKLWATIFQTNQELGHTEWPCHSSLAFPWVWGINWEFSGLHTQQALEPLGHLVLVTSVLNSQVWVTWNSSRSIIMFEVFLPTYWRELWLYVITCQLQFYDRSKKSCWLLICSAFSVVRTLVMTSKLLICQTKMNYLFLTFF